MTRDGAQTGRLERLYGRCSCGNVASGLSGLCGSCRYGSCKNCGNKANGAGGLCRTCSYGFCKVCGNKAHGPGGLCKRCGDESVCVTPDCDRPGVGESHGLCRGHSARLSSHNDTYPDIPLGHLVRANRDQQRPSCVYVAYNAYGEPIYIGSSFGDGSQRFAWHRKFQPWAREVAEFRIYSEHPTRGEAYDAEAVLIKEWSTRYKLYNKQGLCL